MCDDRDKAPILRERDFLAVLDLDRADIKDIHIYHDRFEGLTVDVTLNVRKNICPVCNTVTTKVKGYTEKKIRHSVINTVECTINYHARRYVCPFCGKTFYEENPFVLNRLKISTATVYNVLQELKRPGATFTSVGQMFHLSPASVSRVFDRYVRPERLPLPECLSFDETYAFKNRNSSYVCVLMDYRTGNVVDLLPSRRKDDLVAYFKTIPLSERENVRYVSFDMWYTYRNVAKQAFPNCVTIVDKFHIIAELNNRVQSVRIGVMNNIHSRMMELKNEKRTLEEEGVPFAKEKEAELRTLDTNYYLLKKFNFLLREEDPEAFDPNREKKFNSKLKRHLNYYDIYNLIMEIDPDIEEAVDIKDIIQDFYRKTRYEDAEEELDQIITMCRTSHVWQMQKFSNTLVNWKPEIVNSFMIIPGIGRKMNNALIENRNKCIKLLKKSANGYTNWDRFKKRAMLAVNKEMTIKI